MATINLLAGNEASEGLPSFIKKMDYIDYMGEDTNGDPVEYDPFFPDTFYKIIIDPSMGPEDISEVLEYIDSNSNILEFTIVDEAHLINLSSVKMMLTSVDNHRKTAEELADEIINQDEAETDIFTEGERVKIQARLPAIIDSYKFGCYLSYLDKPEDKTKRMGVQYDFDDAEHEILTILYNMDFDIGHYDWPQDNVQVLSHNPVHNVVIFNKESKYQHLVKPQV